MTVSAVRGNYRGAKRIIFDQFYGSEIIESIPLTLESLSYSMESCTGSPKNAD